MTTRHQTPGQSQFDRWLPAIAAVAVLAVVVLIGVVSGGDDGPLDAVAQSSTSGGSASGLTVPVSTLPGVVIGSAPPGVTKTSLSRTLVRGLAGDDVTRLQTRLTELGFDPGVPDGSFGDQTEQAVWAFEKLVLKTPRAQATGKVNDATWQLMQDTIAISLQPPCYATADCPGNGLRTALASFTFTLTSLDTPASGMVTP